MTRILTEQQQENLRAWAKELIFGDKEQGQGKLASKAPAEDMIRYCCLGVLCEVALAHGVEVQRTEVSTPSGVTYFAYDGQQDFLPDSVVQWAGLGDNNPTLAYTPEDGGEAIIESASSFNDGDAGIDYALSFPSIGRLILEAYDLGEIEDEGSPETIVQTA